MLWAPGGSPAPEVGVQQRPPTCPVVHAPWCMEVRWRACDAMVTYMFVPGGTPERSDNAEAPTNRLGGSLLHEKHITAA